MLHQLPPHDSEERYCHSLTEEERQSLRLFSAWRKSKALGQGTICLVPLTSTDCCCQKCGQIIGGGGATVFAESSGEQSSWHPSCFRCYTCEELLVELIYFQEDGRLYCGRHHAELFKPRCAACDQLIFTDECTEAEGSHWHIQHFCCIECDKVLGGQRYVMREGRPYCYSCFENIYAEYCEACGEKIGIDCQATTYQGQHWHSSGSCFSCVHCKMPILGNSFIVEQGLLYCCKSCKFSEVAAVADCTDTVLTFPSPQEMHTTRTSEKAKELDSGLMSVQSSVKDTPQSDVRTLLEVDSTNIAVGSATQDVHKSTSKWTEEVPRPKQFHTVTGREERTTEQQLNEKTSSADDTAKQQHTLPKAKALRTFAHSKLQKCESDAGQDSRAIQAYMVKQLTKELEGKFKEKAFTSKGLDMRNPPNGLPKGWQKKLQDNSVNGGITENELARKSQKKITTGIRVQSLQTQGTEKGYKDEEQQHPQTFKGIPEGNGTLTKQHGLVDKKFSEEKTTDSPCQSKQLHTPQGNRKPKDIEDGTLKAKTSAWYRNTIAKARFREGSHTWTKSKASFPEYHPPMSEQIRRKVVPSGGYHPSLVESKRACSDEALHTITKRTEGSRVGAHTKAQHRALHPSASCSHQGLREAEDGKCLTCSSSSSDSEDDGFFLGQPLPHMRTELTSGAHTFYSKKYHKDKNCILS
ncbi:prickle-like protein 1-A isoform X2 [Protopterus annectens]|nr:prickle-like protein 1-A isoform X2 [Protopterus annectens]